KRDWSSDVCSSDLGYSSISSSALSFSTGTILTSADACNSSTAPVGVPAVINAASILPSWIPPVDSPKSKFCASISSMDKPCRSEEHTSELQSRFDLVCRLLLEQK